MHFPAPGENFEGKYLIDKVLGSGGFARVYLATEVGLQRPVALKVLMPPNVEAKSNTQRDQWLNSTISRFEREAQILSRLRCPHTVNVYAFGRTDDGLMYMALEYVEGLNLTELMMVHGVLSPDRVVRILRQILLSLQEAHSQGMLHRDIKPANIMVFDHMGVADNVKLLDFGIAKAVGEMKAKSADLTGDGTLIGTPRYMSPEQIQGEPEVGPPSDIYSLGLVIYELLMGERAIKVENSLQIIGQQLAPGSFAIPPGARVPAGLKAVINRMLEKDLSKRFQTVEQILTAISVTDLLAADPDSLPDITSSIESEAIVEDGTGATSRTQYVAIGVLILVILVLVAINALRSNIEQDKGTPSVSLEMSAPIGAHQTSDEADGRASQKEVEEVPDAKVHSKLKVFADIEGVDIWVGGVAIGRAPIEVDVLDFPIQIEANYKGHIQRAEILSETESVQFEFGAKAKGKETEEEKSQVSNRPKRPPKSDSVTKTEKKSVPRPDSMFPLIE